MSGNVTPCFAVVTVTVKGAAAPLTAGELGDAEHWARAGAPVQVRFTVPVKPPTGLIWRLYVAVWPALTVAEADPPVAAPRENRCPCRQEILIEGCRARCRLR